MSATLHIHVKTESRECDGPLEHTHVIRPGDFPDICLDDFWDGIVRLHTPTYAEPGMPVRMELTEDVFWYYRPTDEGFSTTRLTLCKGAECAHEEPRQRDYYAEAMGY